MQILFAIPPLTAALVMVLLDRNLGAHFFDAQNGGSAYLWQHLFWFFGHPEVYILILPVFGMISEVIPVFSRKVLFGYEFMAAATVAIAFISLGVWAHHMFAVGMSRTRRPLLRRGEPARLDPDRHQVVQLAGHDVRRRDFAWPRRCCSACGFLSMFLIGGLTGIMLAVAPFDFQLTDSYFVVGHFHWVLDRRHPVRHLSPASITGIPKPPAGCYPSGWRAGSSGCFFIGFILTFGPMHISGILGMPRRIYTYHADRAWTSGTS